MWSEFSFPSPRLFAGPKQKKILLNYLLITNGKIDRLMPFSLVSAQSEIQRAS